MQAALLDAAAGGSGAVGAWMWVFLVAVGVLCMGCIFLFLRMTEQKSDYVPPVAGGSMNSLSSQLSSVATLAGPGASSRSLPAADGPLGSARRRQGSDGAGNRSGAGGRAQLDAAPHAVHTRSVCGALDAGGSLFAVPLDALVGAASGGGLVLADVFTSQKLRALVSHDSFGGRKVQLFSGEDAANPCISAEPSLSGSHTTEGSFELYDMNGQRCGIVTPQSEGSFVVLAEGQPQLTIDGSGSDWTLRISSRDVRSSATVSRIQDQPGGPERVEIHVLPGLDPVLVVACTLAILLLSGDGSRGAALTNTTLGATREVKR